jgi:purine-binding chemotaxis protein CheW
MAVFSRLLLIRIEGHLFALEAASLKQVVPLERPTPVPRSPQSLLGLIAVQGDILPLLDMAPLLDLEGEGFDPPYAIILESKGQLWAIAAEEVVGLVVNLEEMEPRERVFINDTIKRFSKGTILHQGTQAAVIDLRVLDQFDLANV